jgi:hypothetical protein
MTETYVAVTPCRYNKKRFRIGDPLPPGWEPNKHFLPAETARNRIQREKYINMGFDPDREQAARAAQQGRNREMRGGIDMDEAARVMKTSDRDKSKVRGIDFTTLDAKTEITKEKLGNALFDQFGLKLNWKVINKADLIAAGKESAKRAG